MTIVSILGGDFEIALADEKDATNTTGPGLRVVRRASGAGSTVYTTNQLYSAVAEAADDFIVMGFTNPMLPTTPNAYTMENQYFIPRSSTQYLKEGSITADWSLSASPDTNGHGVIKVKYAVIPTLTLLTLENVFSVRMVTKVHFWILIQIKMVQKLHGLDQLIQLP